MTVSEGAGLPEDIFDISIGVDTLRVSENDILIAFILQDDRSTAAVSTYSTISPQSDALFGSRNEPDYPIEEYYELSNEPQIPPRIVTIVDDLRIELIECFIIRINFVHFGQREPLAICNEVGTSFFCEHTVCIEDDDGKTLKCINITFCIAFFIVIFMVGFVQTIYTAMEGIESVEVCVELTSPTRDIHEETVTVSVRDYSASTYIPAGATLASMELCYTAINLQTNIFSVPNNYTN